MSKKVPPTRIYTVGVVLDKIVSVRDDTGYLLAQQWPKAFFKEASAAPITPSSISLDDLLEKSLTIVYRETRQLLEQSARGSLGKDAAHSMRENLKLIVELKKKEQELLNAMSDDEIKKYLEDRKA